MKELMAWAFSICGTRLMVHFLDGQTKSREIDLATLPLPADFVQRDKDKEDPRYDWAWQLYCRRCCVLMDASGAVIAMRISNVDATVCPW